MVVRPCSRQGITHITEGDADTYREAVARLFAEALDLDVELEDSLTINLAGTQLAARYSGG